MNHPFKALYKDSLSLLTDLYQVTMAYSYWKSGSWDKEAVFNVSFRKNPFAGGFAIACGLTHLLDYFENLHFDESDIEYLGTLKGPDGSQLFCSDFLKFLHELKFELDIDAVPDGTVVFAHEPILRVRGKVLACQLLETVFLNIINFQTLIATKAARIRLAAKEKRILEFGLRRAQGSDGGVSASWAAYIGGCDATSNVLAGKIHGVPVVGTHAHSWVMSFDTELKAFEQYAESMPNNCTFLVDTYETLEGVRHAIQVGKRLREKGHDLLGVRLDSGDLAYLSIEARRILDEAGFQNTKIVATNDLDEHIIQSLSDQGAKIDVWGVGTKLITAYDQPALGAVYKLAAIRDDDSDWQYKVKLSEQAVKTSTPGMQQVRRFISKVKGEELYLGDMVFDENAPPTGEWMIVDPIDFTRRKVIPGKTEFQDLLKPVVRAGKVVYNSPDAKAIKEYSRAQLQRFHPGIKRLLNPHQYPVGLEISLHKKRTELILKARKFQTDELTTTGSQTKGTW